MSQFWDSKGRDVIIPTSGVEIRPLMRMVFAWMTLGLLVTAAVAVTVSSTPSLSKLIYSPGVMIGAMALELGLVLALGFGLRRMSPGVAAGAFLVYAAVNGFTLSVIFLVYALGTIGAAFITTAGVFGVMTFLGYTTQIDLSQYRSYFIMGLIGLIVASIVNVFLRSSGFDFIISLFGVAIFTALTAYDVQRIKRLAADPALEADKDSFLKIGIYGALQLYLDFINLFLYLLRLFGGRRR